MFFELVSILFAIVPDYGNEYMTKENKHWTSSKNFTPKLNLNHNIYIHKVIISLIRLILHNVYSPGSMTFLRPSLTNDKTISWFFTLISGLRLVEKQRIQNSDHILLLRQIPLSTTCTYRLYNNRNNNHLIVHVCTVLLMMSLNAI